MKSLRGESKQTSRETCYPTSYGLILLGQVDLRLPAMKASLVCQSGCCGLLWVPELPVKLRRTLASSTSGWTISCPWVQKGFERREDSEGSIFEARHNEYHLLGNI